MKIVQGATVSITYTMSFENGDIISSNQGESPLSFVQGRHEIFQGLELHLDGLEDDAATTVSLTPDQAYGHVNPDAVVTVPVDQLPEDAREAGAVVETRDSGEQVMTGEVTGIVDGSATIDFNHPLAGKTIRFDIKVVSVTQDGGPEIA